MPYTYQYPHPAVTVDTIIFALHEGDLKVLLIQRKHDPHAGLWALPGGFVEIDEGLDDAARRELKEETGVEHVFLEQLHTFGAPGRDPRERIISVAYYALVRFDQLQVQPASDANAAGWFPVRKLPTLAFDHAQIMDIAVRRLRERMLVAPVILDLLPPTFAIEELQTAYEIVARKKLDGRSFSRMMLATGVLVPVANRRLTGGNRKKLLYRLDSRKYERMAAKGLALEIELPPQRKQVRG